MFSALWVNKPQAPKPRLTQLQQIIQIDGLVLYWRKSARRKRSLTLKLDKTGHLIVMTPLRAHESDVQQFVLSRLPWIHQQLATYALMSTSKAKARGKTLWFMGEELNICTQIGLINQIKRVAKTLEITTRYALKADTLDVRVKKWQRLQAQNILASHLVAMSDRTGLTGRGHKIKHYTARWGSCRHDGLIQLNWKLVMTPSAVIDYVILHELCHLEHFNHSAQFWALVARYCPQYKLQRLWLKQNGPLLL